MVNLENEIRQKSECISGYYVLIRKSENLKSVYCNYEKFKKLYDCLYYNNGVFYYGKSYLPDENLAYHFNIKLTARKTIQKLKAFLESEV